MRSVARSAPTQSERERILRDRNTARTVVVALAVVLLGLGLLYASGRSELWENRLAGQALVAQLGGLLLGAVALSALWEFVGKRNFADEILARVGVGADIDRAGLIRVTDQYLKEVEWDSYFAGAQKVDVVVAYGRTWRRTHWDQLQKIAATSGNRIRVLLPDPLDTASLGVLADRFDRTPLQLKNDILESAKEFRSLRVTGGADVSVLFRRGDQVFSCYRLDQIAVVTLYSHSRERRPVPTFVCRSGGSLYAFIRQEIDAMLTHVREPAADELAPQEGA